MSIGIKIYNQGIRILSGFIPLKSLRKKFRNRFFKRIPLYFVTHSLYGKLYMPHYELHHPILCQEPEIYNAQGERMRTFFVRSYLDAHYPNSDSKYFLWDRFNVSLPVHFYKHRAILETILFGSKRNSSIL